MRIADNLVRQILSSRQSWTEWRVLIPDCAYRLWEVLLADPAANNVDLYLGDPPPPPLNRLYSGRDPTARGAVCPAPRNSSGRGILDPIPGRQVADSDKLAAL